MPSRPLTACPYPGCKLLVKSTRECADVCPRKSERFRDTRPSAAKRGYGERHKQWRKVVLSRANHLCQHCKRAEATEADHIVAIAKGGSRFDLRNGMGLCKSCHSKKTAREDGSFGRKKR